MLFIRAGDLLEPHAARALSLSSPSPAAPKAKPALSPQQTPQTPKPGSRFLARSAPLAHEPMQSMGHPTAGAGQERSPWPCHNVFPLGSRGDGSQPPAPRAQECTDTACTEKSPLACKISPSRAAARGGHGSLCLAITLLQRSTRQNLPKNTKTRRKTQAQLPARARGAALTFSASFPKEKKLLLPSRAQHPEGREVPPGHERRVSWQTLSRAVCSWRILPRL